MVDDEYKKEQILKIQEELREQQFTELVKKGKYYD